MDALDAGLITDFVVVSQEGLANIEQQMLAIEAGGSEIDLNCLKSCFLRRQTTISFPDK